MKLQNNSCVIIFTSLPKDEQDKIEKSAKEHLAVMLENNHGSYMESLESRYKMDYRMIAFLEAKIKKRNPDAILPIINKRIEPNTHIEKLIDILLGPFDEEDPTSFFASEELDNQKEDREKDE